MGRPMLDGTQTRLVMVACQHHIEITFAHGTRQGFGKVRIILDDQQRMLSHCFFLPARAAGAR
jgi:hypothetical protein